MPSRKARTKGNRRDRRKAKQSGFAREGTKNPKKVTHHMSFKVDLDSVLKDIKRRKRGKKYAN